MLEKFLSQLGASTRITVGVSVSPNVGLEMIEVDRTSGIVNKYSSKPLEYNSSTREIANYDQFRIGLEELFEELNIPKRSNIVLSLPNVYFGMINLPLLLTDDAVTNAIVSEVEQSYIFKRQEPVVGWSDIASNAETNDRLLAYTAIQKQTLDEISEICDEIGCTITCVENSFTSLLRTLHYLDLTKEQMKENTSWNLMIIMQNNYSIISMKGKKTIEYFEEPLALKSFIDDEIYNAIKTSAQLTLAGLPANNLFIVSETDLVSAEVLSMKMPFEGNISFLESNKFIQKELMPINLNILPNKAFQITPEAIGTAIYQFCDYPLKLNVIKNQDGTSGTVNEYENYLRVNIGNLEVELTPGFIKKLLLMLAATTILPITILLLLINNLIIPKEQIRLTKVQSQIESINQEINKYEDANQEEVFDAYATTNNIINQNKSKLAYYSALGISIPNKLWVTYYETNSGGKVDIKGASADVKSIYTFYKNIKQMINNSAIKLRKLEIASDSVDTIIQNNYNLSNIYAFEITDMTESELNSDSTKNGTQQNPQDPNSSQKTEDKKDMFQFGQTFFNQQNGAQQNKTEQNVGTATQTNEENLPPNLKKIEKF